MIPRRRFLVLTAALLAGPGAAAKTPPQLWRGTALGADVTLRVAGADRRTARAFFAAAARALRGVEADASLFRDSALVRLNRTGRLDRPPPRLRALLDLSARVHAATGGAFDPSIGALWDAVRRGAPPDPALLGFADVRWSATGSTLPRPGMALTLNGIAQGHAADRLAALAGAHGLTDVLIDTGEFVAAPGRSWRVAIAAPDGTILRRVRLRGLALATSSPWGTRIGRAGEAPHILDPRGGAPRWRTVSVTAPEAAIADALSTAGCVMDRAGLEAACAALGARIAALQPA